MDHIAPLETDEEIKTKSSITFTKLLIHGYIRKIQLLLDERSVIPEDIYSICLLFYQIKEAIIFWKNHKITQMVTNESRQFGILDIENRSSKSIKVEKFQSFDGSEYHPLCYIPEIKNKHLTNGQTLNGIFMLQKEQNYYLRHSGFSSCPCLIIFDKEEQTIFAKFEYKSRKNINHEPPQLLYIESKNMVLYEWNGSFYSFNLHDVKDIDDLHKIRELPQKRQKFTLNTFSRRRHNHDRLHMLYLNYPMNAIFAIKTESGGLLPATNKEYPRTARCGIFRIESKDWIDIKPFKWMTIDDASYGALYCSLCCNNDNDKVFVIYNNFRTSMYTSKYDIYKDEWRTISRGNKPILMNPFWYSNNMLYGLSNSLAMGSEYLLHTLDLRDSTRQWMSDKIHFDNLDIKMRISFWK